MKSLLKFLFSLLIFLVVLILVAVVAAPFIVDPNDFKPQIARVIQDRTGRTVEIPGELKLTVFPWLGVETGQVTVGNAPGFDDPVFARVERAQVGVRLAPLLRREVEAGTVVLHGLHVRLARDAQGRTNWEDLARASPPPSGEAPREVPATGEEPPGALRVEALVVGGLDIQNARVDWDDQQTGQRYAVKDISLQTGAIVPGRPVDVEVAFEVEGGTPVLTALVEAKGQVEADPVSGRYGARGLVFTASARGESLPASPLDLRLEARIDADLAQQTLTVSDLVIDTLGITGKGALAAEQILGDLRYNASLDVPAVDPRDLARRLGMDSLQTTDPKALSHASLNTRASGTAGSVRLEPLTVKVDDTTIQGHLAVPSFAGPAIRFGLSGDALDADRYLPPKSGGTSQAGAPAPAPSPPAPGSGESGGPVPTPGAVAAAAVQLPLAGLRALDLAGELKLDRLKVGGLAITDVAFKVSAEKGVIRLDPVGAQLYQGLYRGNVTLNATGDVPRLAVDERLTAVQVGPLLKDLLGEDRLTGKGQAQAKLQASGAAPQAILANLDGTVGFAFTDGALKGVNIARMIREAQAAIKGERLAPEAGEQKTDFSEIRGTMRFADGIGSNDDFYAKSPLLRVEGRGTVDLPRERLDYLVTTTLVRTLEGQGGKELEDLVGVPIPIRLTGSFQEPKWQVDLEEILKQKASQELKKKADEQIDKKLGRELEKKLGAEGAKGVQDALKGLFR